MTGTNMCAMSVQCEGKEADHGLMCADCRAIDREIERRFSDDVQPDQREQDGDIEGSECIRELADAISKIPLSEYR